MRAPAIDTTVLLVDDDRATRRGSGAKRSTSRTRSSHCSRPSSVTPDRVVARSALMREVWGSDTSVTSKALDATVRRLRQKLGGAATGVVTVRGVGFRFEPVGEKLGE